MFLKESAAAKVKILNDCSVKNVHKNEVFEIETNQGVFTCENLVIATGGLSFPKIGATDFGYKIARQFGLKIVPTSPSLVPLVFADGKNFSRLAGVSIDARVSTGKKEFRENILFTHKGLSGPAILQISNYWRRENQISIDLLPDLDAANLFEKNISSKQTLENFLSKFLPNRFAESFALDEFSNKPLNQLNKKDRKKISEKLDDWQILFGETEGYHKAEVTRGGINTNELSSQTMESKRVKGLFFIGEVVDVTGWLGGYNFQWAWASGFAAGNSL